jgi:predicted Fe-Mo cluster-binding NifX family protein
MKIAIASDDQETISHHFGKTKGFVVVEIRNKEVISKTYRESTAGSGCGSGGCNHDAMISTIKDCDFVISYGMGMGIYKGLMQRDITAIVTDEERVDQAITEFINESLSSNLGKLH